MNKLMPVIKRMLVLLLPALLGGLAGWAEQPVLTNSNIEFTVTAPNARTVRLVGDFNNWSPVATPMHKRPDGEWAATQSLAAGQHQYKFVVNGKWITDPENKVQVDDTYGGKNSVIVVGPPGQSVNLPPSTNITTKTLNPYEITDSTTSRAYEVEFTFASPDARSVDLTTEFNHWSPTATPMQKRPDGEWAVKVQLPVGRYEYKLVVDGKSIPDPENPVQVDDGHGGKNSVVVIGQ